MDEMDETPASLNMKECPLVSGAHFRRKGSACFRHYEIGRYLYSGIKFGMIEMPGTFGRHNQFKPMSRKR